MNLDQVDFNYNIPPEDFEEIPLASEILPNLWMGMSPLNYDRYDVIVNLEPVIHRHLMYSANSKFFIHYPLYDSDDQSLDPVALGNIALAASDMAIAGKQVLVHCSAGLNRSGVVVALACWYNNVKDPIEHVREKRDKWALCNKTFESWLRDIFNKTARKEA